MLTRVSVGFGRTRGDARPESWLARASTAAMAAQCPLMTPMLNAGVKAEDVDRAAFERRQPRVGRSSVLARWGSKAVVLLLAATAWSAMAQSSRTTIEEIQRYREALQAGNPAELWEMRGEALWTQKRGPLQASLEQCDLGLGPGVVKGAYAQMPRYFSDSDKVQDLESRLVSCITRLQGFTQAEVLRQTFGAGNERKSDLEALVAYVTSESRGVKMAVPMVHPKEKESYALGRKLFFFRGGTHDFACATCHSEGGKRIRLQDLPNLMTKEGAIRGYTTWPAYRVSQGELRTMQHRLWDCFRQQRFPEPIYGSDAITALTMFLARNAEGGVYDAPTQKR